MKRYALIILLFFLSISLMAAPKAKYKSIWLSGCACYDGYQIKKIPEGEGKLTVYNSQDVKCKDVLSGKFIDNKVTDATLRFAGDLIFEGDVSYKLDGTSVTYTLYKGSFTVYTYWKNKYIVDGVEPQFKPVDWESRILVHSSIKPESNPRSVIRFDVADSLVVSRQYRGFDTKHEALVVGASTRKLSLMSKRFIEDFKPLCDNNFEYKETYNRLLNINRGGFSINSDKEKYFKLHIGTDKYAECFGKGYSSFKYVLSNNEERLIVGYTDNPYSPDYLGTELLERYMDGGVITISKTIAEKDIDKSFSAENRAIYNSIKHWPVQDNYPQKYSTGYIQIKYSDGSIYTGSVGSQYYGGLSSSVVSNTIRTVLSYKNLPDRTHYNYGVLDYPDGRQVAFCRGYTLEECVRQSENREEQIKAEEQAEKQAEEQARKDAELKRQREMQTLSNKYGKKYVDTIFESGGRKILVDTPFGLIKEVEAKGDMIDIRLDIDRGTSKCYDWFVHTKVGRYKYGYFWVSNGKVTYVSYTNH